MVHANLTRLNSDALLPWDPYELRSQLTWLPGFTSTDIQAVMSSWGELLEVQEVACKKDSPAIIPTLFKAEAVKWTKGGRPAKTEAESFTALIFDFDLTASVPDWKKGEASRCVEALDIENWLEEHGLAGIYWTTWKSQPGALRWRLVLPLDAPYAAKAHEEAWTFWAKRLEASVGRVDWAPRGVTSIHALPAIPKSRVVGEDDWGGMIPNPVFVEGLLLSPKDAEQKANLHHYANSLKRGASRKGEAWARSKGVKITPYTGDAEASHVPKTLVLWGETRGTGEATDFQTSMDAIAALRVRGLRAKAGSKQGGVLCAAFWNLHRMGFSNAEIGKILEPVVECAGPKYINEFLAHSKHFGKLDASNLWLTNALVLTADIPTEAYKGAFHQFLRIFARAQHLQAPRCGKMAMDQIAGLLGLTKPHVVLWRSRLEELGLLMRQGEGFNRRYTLVEVK